MGNSAVTFRVRLAAVLLIAPFLAGAGELVAHWPMEAVEDGVLKDASGNGHDGETVRIYVNAVLTAEEPVEGVMAPQKRPAILANYVARKNAYPFNGPIDDVKVFSGCLTEDEVFAEAAPQWIG
jgi:Concanavalin A-like lectin/glucanases superfamily